MKIYSAVLWAFFLAVSQSSAVVLSLKNLLVTGSRHNLVVEGIGVNLIGSSQNLAITSLFSDSISFGLDSAGPGDAFSLIDGGSGTAEVLNIVFNQEVFVDSVLISFFGPNDSGSISIKGFPAIQLQTGLNDLGGVIAEGSSLHTIRWTGANESDPDLGFSIDEIVARPVPEPSTALMLGLGAALAFSGRRREFGPLVSSQ